MLLKLERWRKHKGPKDDFPMLPRRPRRRLKGTSQRLFIGIVARMGMMEINVGNLF